MKPEPCVDCGEPGAVLCLPSDKWRCAVHAFEFGRPQPGDSRYEQKAWEARQMIPAFFGRG